MLYKIKYFYKFKYLFKWGLGIGDWGFGNGDWGLGLNASFPTPNFLPNTHKNFIK
jgi:hypothetical protein